MDLSGPCPVCATDYSKLGPAKVELNGEIIILPQAFAGALDWSPYAMLQLMFRDWLRPLGAEDNSGLPTANRPSARALVVLIFWTYFETLMGWFYETATDELPKPVVSDLLGRYGTIGARLDRLHRILFGVRYYEDLDMLGYASVTSHLKRLQIQRNAFVHGNPEAITDALVEETVRFLPEFHEGWVQTFAPNGLECGD
jgi:hypothetical protein